MAEERLQKILARAGIASRRAAEKLMLEGRVRVNGSVADRLGMHADPERDHIRVDGRRLRLKKRAHVYFAAFKPSKMMTTMDDPEGRPTVRDLLRRAGIRQRVVPVGRLDWDTDGLLLLTDDGELGNLVMHPKTHVPKTYRVKVRGHPDRAAVRRLREGVMLHGRGRPVRTRPASVKVEREQETTTWLVMTIVEGRQTQIRRMAEAVGHPVRMLRRVAIGPVRLGRMRVGDVRPLTLLEVAHLREAVGLEPPPGVPGRRRARRGAG